MRQWNGNEVVPGDVIVIRYEGCVGAPGMKEVMLTTDILVGKRSCIRASARLQMHDFSGSIMADYWPRLTGGIFGRTDCNCKRRGRDICRYRKRGG